MTALSSPASDGYRVDLEHLDQVTIKVANLRGFVEDSVGWLDARVTAMHHQWHGAVADEHAAAHREWMRGAQKIKDGIEAMRTAAKGAHDAYGEALAANRKTLGA